MASKSYRYVQHEADIRTCIENFYSDVESLAEEVQELVDNASGTPAENTQRIQTFSDTADTLATIGSNQVDFPDGIDELLDTKITFTTATPKSKKQSPSRAVRCENACSPAWQAIETLRAWCDEQEASFETATTEGAVAVDNTAMQERVDAVRKFCDEVEEHTSEAEGCEFPGMYG